MINMKFGAIYPSLKGRTVLVTGGGSGIGEAIVEHFAAQGSKVGFLDIKEKESKALAKRLRRKRQKVHFEHVDLADIDALKKAIANVRKALGPITILVNNAAHDERHTLEEVTLRLFRRPDRVNLKHQFFAIQAVVPDMKKAKNGSIVNLGSTSWMVAFGGLPVYTAAKAGVLGLTRGLARELGKHNIRINHGRARLDHDRAPEVAVGDAGGAEAADAGPVPAAHAEPADLARAILFFASDESSATTNQTFVFDGGWL
jgi:D-xylose 1-dehydrogenase